MKQKLTNLTLSIPYKRAGNIITHQPVSFDVHEEEGCYSLHPLLSENERAVAYLPEVLRFSMEDGKPVSLRGHRDGNFHVITDAVSKLRELALL